MDGKIDETKLKWFEYIGKKYPDMSTIWLEINN